ncbi:MAG: SGNH/GDSL hydrolase family protein [Salinivirgaceae bacterium]|jgi:hypothetical protein|nr:SGNH/GDSL hydrolase family protein [Salinivirgaceae bacterium]
MIKNNLLYILVIAIFFTGCEITPDEFEVKQGSADFSKTLFIGNSLTAGFRDGELYRSGQMESFPAIIGQQLVDAELMTHFTQPLMPDDQGFGGRRVLGYSANCNGDVGLAPVPTSAAANLAASSANIADQGPFQNLGVPGAMVQHLLFAGYGTSDGNAYFARFASDPTITILEEAMVQDPTFIVTWIGNNDVLGYATSGGANPAKPITDAATFAGALDLVVQTLSANGAKGVLCNIPDVAATPYFTTVPGYALVLNAAQATQLNAAYSNYNQGATAMGLDEMSFSAGPNPFVITDNSAEYAALGNIRQLKQGELVLLTVPQDSLTCYGMGSASPIPDKYVLTETELTAIDDAVTSFNSSVDQVAEAHNWAVVDMNGFFNMISETGLRIAGQDLSTTFVTGGLFGLDGIHLTGQGNAVVANKIIETINTSYGAKLPKAIVNEYTGVIFP